MAADNGTHLVLSGPELVLERVLSDLNKSGIRMHRLNTSHAFHSSLMELVLEEFEGYARGMEFQPARCALISNLTGSAVREEQVLDASYWRRHLREAVQFRRSMQAVAEREIELPVEIGPQPVLLGMAEGCWPKPSARPVRVATLRRGRSDHRQTAEALAELYVHGLTPDFAAWDRPWSRRKLALPTYPFQRRRYCVDIEPARRAPVAAPRLRETSRLLDGKLTGISPLQGVRVELPGSAQIWQFSMSRQSFPEVRDNRGILHMGVLGVCMRRQNRYEPGCFPRDFSIN